MSRLHRVLHGVASSYILLIATALYSLCSVPVALHYLDTSRFGLWVVMGTLASYLNLIDAGVSGASGRLLIDVKDDMEGSRYGELIKTIWLVSTAQGAIIFLIGLLRATRTHIPARNLGTTLQRRCRGLNRVADRSLERSALHRALDSKQMAGRWNRL
jgi:hypothetical protein